MEMKEEEPLISIALCTYNGETYLEEQLFSITRQSYKNIELIIVDDCSSDGTISLIEKHCLQDSRIKLYQNEKNLGFNSNFRKAISLCSAEYIAIADQDDIWAADKLSTLISLIDNNLLYYHNSEYINSLGILTGKSTLSAHRFVAGDCSIRLLLNNCIAGHASMIKKELLNITPEFPAGMYYDWWLAYTAACTGRIGFTKAALVKYRIHPASFTNTHKQHPKLLRINNLKSFAAHPLTPSKVTLFIKKILDGYNEAAESNFSKKLFFLLLKNYHILFFTRKRSFFSNFRFIIKESTH